MAVQTDRQTDRRLKERRRRPRLLFPTQQFTLEQQHFYTSRLRERKRREQKLLHGSCLRPRGGGKSWQKLFSPLFFFYIVKANFHFLGGSTSKDRSSPGSNRYSIRILERKLGS